MLKRPILCWVVYKTFQESINRSTFVTSYSSVHRIGSLFCKLFVISWLDFEMWFSLTWSDGCNWTKHRRAGSSTRPRRASDCDQQQQQQQVSVRLTEQFCCCCNRSVSSEAAHPHEMPHDDERTCTRVSVVRIQGPFNAVSYTHLTLPTILRV